MRFVVQGLYGTDPTQETCPINIKTCRFYGTAKHANKLSAPRDVTTAVVDADKETTVCVLKEVPVDHGVVTYLY